jgi:hypothetical protein
MMWHDYPGVAERFEAKIDRSAMCWLWTGGKAGAGYGTFRLSRPARRYAYAHRLALERKLGRDLVHGEYALHECDTPSCVNPDHLSVGDQWKNMGDAAHRGRAARGQHVKGARLTDGQVREIWALLGVPGLTHAEIGRRYGVSRANITQIKTGRSWSHITRAKDTVTITAPRP